MLFRSTVARRKTAATRPGDSPWSSTAAARSVLSLSQPAARLDAGAAACRRWSGVLVRYRRSVMSPLLLLAGPYCWCCSWPTRAAAVVRGSCVTAAYWWSTEGAVEALAAARLHLGAIVFSLGVDLGAAVFAVAPRRCTLLLPIG